MSKEKGGNAFPVQHRNACIEEGMTLRDYFAGQVLLGVLTTPDPIKINGKTVSNPEEAAEVCYGYADAMIKERSKDC